MHQKKGKILRVKMGYNPNSSSVGSQIPAFLLFAVSTGAVAVVIGQLFNLLDLKLRKKKESPDGESSQ